MNLKIAMSIVDWFDCSKRTHLLAYQHFRRTGTWEFGFLPENILFPTSWAVLLTGKIVDYFLNKELNEYC